MRDSQRCILAGSFAIISAEGGSVGSMSSGCGTSGMLNWCSTPGSLFWNEDANTRIGWPCWIAVTRRTLKLWPSRARSTSKMIGAVMSPARRK
jgi:hypothetical protein